MNTIPARGKARQLVMASALAGSLVTFAPAASASVSVGVHWGYPGHYYPHYYSYYYYPWVNPYFWPGPYAGSYGYGAYGYISPDMGALDLNIHPKKTSIYVNGEYVGTAKSYDGWPRYLWLPKGDYRLVYHLEGYRTLVREFTVHPGVVQSIRTEMEAVEAGETRPPEELFEKRPRVAETPAQPAPAPQAPEAESGERPWRYERPAERPAVETERWREQRDLRSEPARLLLDLRPEDAVAYLDGRFLGSGRELGRLHAPLLIDPGAHVLEVVRPGYDTRRIEFQAESARDVEIEAALERAPSP